MKSQLLALTFFPAILASSSVTNITNNINSTVDTSSNSHCQTSITTETNGKTEHVESSDCGNIHVETKNDQTTVQTSPGMNVNVTPDTKSQTITQTPTPAPSASPTVLGTSSGTISHKPRIKHSPFELNEMLFQLKQPINWFLSLFHFHR